MLRRHVRLPVMSSAPVQLDRPEPRRPEPPDRALAAAETLARWLDGRFLDPLLGLLLPGDGAVRGHWSDTLVVAGALLLFLASLAMPIVAVAWLWHAVSAR